MRNLAIFLLALAIFSLNEVSAQPYEVAPPPYEVAPPPYEVSAQPYAWVTSIEKDNKTSLYSINLQGQFVIDINGPFLWYSCDNWEYAFFPCQSSQCINARSDLFCPSNNAYNDYNQCICMVTPVNPITNSCASAQLTFTPFTIGWTRGRNVEGWVDLDNLIVSCAPPSLFQSLPEGSYGVAGLSWNLVSIAMQVERKFALCLPSTGTTNGVFFFGVGPYFLGQTDLSTVLSYTPLLRLQGSKEYFIGLEGISVNGKKIELQSNYTFEFDQQRNGGVQLSTIVPYTTFRSDIYKIFLKKFSKATKYIPRAQKVVHPFDLCLKTSEIGRTHVPEIGFQLRNGAIWRINGANSFKQVEDDVACLAFVDGGKSAKRAVVIGSYQMENNLLQFDLSASRFGFSNSLSFYNTTCSNFNFTSTLV